MRSERARCSSQEGIYTVPAKCEREHDIFPHGQRRYQVESLENEAKLIAPQHGHRIIVERTEVEVAEQDLSRSETVQPSQAMEERRLTATPTAP